MQHLFFEQSEIVTNKLSTLNRLRRIISENGIITPHVQDIPNVDLVEDPHLKLHAFLYGVSSLVWVEGTYFRVVSF